MIRLYDTKAREKRDFEPGDPERVTLYVCGPTVYNRAHIGNARPAVVFDVLAGKLVARRVGGGVRRSVIGPVDRILGAGFGVLKGIILATLLYLGANLVYDTIWGAQAERPDWMANSRTYPLLYASGRAIVDFVEWRRGAPAEPRYRPAPPPRDPETANAS